MNSEFGAWNSLKEHYFPEGEYRKLWKIVDKHVHKYHALPTFEDLKLEVRSRELQEKTAGGIILVDETKHHQKLATNISQVVAMDNIKISVIKFIALFYLQMGQLRKLRGM